MDITEASEVCKNSTKSLYMIIKCRNSLSLSPLKDDKHDDNTKYNVESFQRSGNQSLYMDFISSSSHSMNKTYL